MFLIWISPRISGGVVCGGGVVVSTNHHQQNMIFTTLHFSSINSIFIQPRLPYLQSLRNLYHTMETARPASIRHFGSSAINARRGSKRQTSILRSTFVLQYGLACLTRDEMTLGLVLRARGGFSIFSNLIQDWYMLPSP